MNVLTRERKLHLLCEWIRKWLTVQALKPSLTVRQFPNHPHSFLGQPHSEAIRVTDEASERLTLGMSTNLVDQSMVGPACGARGRGANQGLGHKRFVQDRECPSRSTRPRKWKPGSRPWQAFSVLSASFAQRSGPESEDLSSDGPVGRWNPSASMRCYY